MPCSQFADNLQFFFFEGNPRRIVGIAVDDGRHIPVLQFLLQFFAECLSPIGEDVELLPFDTQDAKL